MKKPYVICLMASSVDGRVLPSRWRPKGAAGNLFERVHDDLAVDAWLVGRVTGQEFAKGKPYPPSTKEAFPREPWFARRDAKAYNVVLDAHGKVGWGVRTSGTIRSWSCFPRRSPMRTWRACAAKKSPISLPGVRISTSPSL